MSGSQNPPEGSNPVHLDLGQYQVSSSNPLPVAVVSGGGGGGGTTTANQGTAAAASGAWPVYLGSGPGTAAGSPAYTQVTNFPATQPVSGTVSVGNFPATQPVSGTVAVSNQPVGTAGLATGQAAMSATVAAVVAARTGAPGTGRVAVTVNNFGASTVFIGASGVTATTGFALQPGSFQTFNTTATLYGITSSGTSTVSFAETF